ncbi:Swt1 family HEPN domain-containing protein [Brevundimonas sp.]|uniref:Swt1 family HEPN domain-containing protein n=1 Tax=Brevundimonas sp. TaxID=1871086 RepID=UPI002FD9F6D4
MTGTVRPIRDFIFNGFALEGELHSIMRRLDGPTERGLGRFAGEEIVEPYIDQLAQEDREDARFMAQYYEVFYLIENMLRRMIAQTMESTYDDRWWHSRVPQAVKDSVARTQSREIDSAVTPRSSDPIDFTTFGELSQIISFNGDAFGGVFTSVKAAERVIGLMNTLRGPIAHCGYLTDDEVARLYLAVRDLFRLMAAA